MGIAPVGAVRAATVTVRVGGIVDLIDDPSGLATAIFQDALLDGLLRYDTEAPGTEASGATPPVSINYDEAITDVDVSVGPLLLEMGGSNDVFIRDGVVLPDLVSFVIGSGAAIGVPEITSASFWVYLGGPVGTLGSEEPPKTNALLPLERYSYRRWKLSFSVDSQIHDVFGIVTSLSAVPEPSSLTLLSVGLFLGILSSTRPSRAHGP